MFAWLDVHLKGAPPFNQVGPLSVVKPRGVPAATWESSGPREVKSAELILSYGDEGNWTSRYWIRHDAKREHGRYTAHLPHSSIPYYIGGAITDTQGFRYSTPLVKIDPAKLAIEKNPVPPDYNGCSEWGGFEPDHVMFLKAHAFMNPTTSTDAKEGKQSCVLKAKTEARYLLFTAGLPHRFTCYLKADKEIEVKVVLTGAFDGKAQTEEKAFKVSKDWAPVTMDYLPPKCIVGTLSALFTVPEGATALLDCAQFRPTVQ